MIIKSIPENRAISPQGYLGAPIKKRVALIKTKPAKKR